MAHANLLVSNSKKMHHDTDTLKTASRGAMPTAIDWPGAMLIGTALLMLLGRTLIAIVKAGEVEDAVKVHHAARPRRLRALYDNVFDIWSSVPSRLRLGLGLGLIVTLGGLLPLTVRNALPESWAADGPIGRAATLAAKWTVVGGAIRWFRAWAVAQMRARREAAAGAGT